MWQRNDGVNTCGWGSNTGMNASAGSCVFVLPPGGDGYNCEMEWGAASFTATSVTKTLGSAALPRRGRAPPRPAPRRGARRAPVARVAQ